MTAEKEKLLQAIEARADELFALGCDIFDHPEQGGQEQYASQKLTGYLEQHGFQVERGVGGMPTSFRAVRQLGQGGPSIGFLMEYDALRDVGHACGHHLQGPTCIAAALAMADACPQPFRLVLYGTPDEEIRGGKITMEKNGCFRDADVMLNWHAGGSTGVSGGSRALAATRVTFHGRPAHAGGSPEKGRSALDAMMLAFHGLEILREHVKEGSRIHYTVLEGTGPSNVVHEKAKAHITLRARDRRYLLEDMQPRMEKVLQGACTMTETTAELERLDAYWDLVPVPALSQAAIAAAEEIGAEKIKYVSTPSGGSTDVGNVSWVAPTVEVYTPYSEGGAHSEQWLRAGKLPQARTAMITGAKILALVGLRSVEDAAFLAAVQQEHRAAVEGKEEK